MDANTWWDENAPAGSTPAPRGTPVANALQAQITALYQTYYGRVPTAQELSTHVANISAGRGSLAHIEAELDRVAQAQKLGKYAPGASATTPKTAAEWKTWFEALTKGKDSSVASLLALEAELTKAGIKLVPNKTLGPDGKPTNYDIQLPDGTIVDVLLQGGKGGWAWQTGDGAAGGDPNGLTSFGELMAPWDKEFSFDTFKPPERFTAPTMEQVAKTPGFQFRLGEGLKALERQAAGKGVLRTTGTMKALNDYAQDVASTEYASAYQRALGEHTLNYGEAAGEWERDYGKALGEFQQAYNIFEGNQGKRFNRLASIAGIGQTAAGSLNGAGQGYAGLFGNTTATNAAQIAALLGAGANATAAGQVGSANAWNSFFGGLGNNVTNLASLYALTRPPQKPAVP